MKKIFLLCLFLILLTDLVSAEDTKWFAFGYERSGYSYSTSAISPGSIAFGANGINFQSYSFKDKKSKGWFSSTTIRVPNVKMLSDGTYTEAYAIHNLYDMALSLDIKFGMGIRSNPANVVQFYGGIGPHAAFAFFRSSYYDSGSIAIDENDFALGAGLELGAKFNFNERVSLLLGSGCALDLASHYYISVTDGNQTVSDSDWYEGYLGVDLSPKLCLNFQW